MKECKMFSSVCVCVAWTYVILKFYIGITTILIKLLFIFKNKTNVHLEASNALIITGLAA